MDRVGRCRPAPEQLAVAVHGGWPGSGDRGASSTYPPTSCRRSPDQLPPSRRCAARNWTTCASGWTAASTASAWTRSISASTTRAVAQQPAKPEELHRPRLPAGQPIRVPRYHFQQYQPENLELPAPRCSTLYPGHQRSAVSSAGFAGHRQYCAPHRLHGLASSCSPTAAASLHRGTVGGAGSEDDRGAGRALGNLQPRCSAQSPAGAAPTTTTLAQQLVAWCARCAARSTVPGARN